MRRLPNDRMRRFVIAMLESPTSNYTACAYRAGYTGGDEVMRQTGCRLAHDERILAAIQEEARGRMASGAIYAVSRLLELIADPKVSAANQLRGIEMLLNRVGLHAKIETTQNINHNILTDDSMIKRIAALAGQLGLNPTALLGSAGVVLDNGPQPNPLRQIAAADDLSDILGE